MTSAPTSGVLSLAGWSPSSVGIVVGADSSSSFSDVGDSKTKKYKELKKKISYSNSPPKDLISSISSVAEASTGGISTSSPIFSTNKINFKSYSTKLSEGDH